MPMRSRHTSGNMQREQGAQGAREKGLIAQWGKIAAVVCIYWFVSISMVFLNKYLLSSPALKLDAPLFITFSQCAVAVICFLCLGASSKYYTAISFPALEFDIKTAVKVLPLSIIFVCMITFNNFTLKYLGVAFYNVGRSLTTVFNVMFSYAVLGQKISFLVLSCCGVIVFGFLLGLKEEEASVHLSFFGVAFGVSASLSVALYAIFTKRILPLVDSNIWRLQFYNNTNAVVLLMPMVLLMGEGKVLRDFQFWWSSMFWGLIITAGIFGIAIGYITALQIQVTSPLTHNVSGTAKAGAQTVLACVVYSETKPLWWWVSNALVLCGSSAYTYVRMTEMKADRDKPGSVGGEAGQNKTLQILEGGGEEKESEQ